MREKNPVLYNVHCTCSTVYPNWTNLRIVETDIQWKCKRPGRNINLLFSKAKNSTGIQVFGYPGISMQDFPVFMNTGIQALRYSVFSCKRRKGSYVVDIVRCSELYTALHKWSWGSVSFRCVY